MAIINKDSLHGQTPLPKVPSAESLSQAMSQSGLIAQAQAVARKDKAKSPADGKAPDGAGPAEVEPQAAVEPDDARQTSSDTDSDADDLSDLDVQAIMAGIEYVPPPSLQTHPAAPPEPELDRYDDDDDYDDLPFDDGAPNPFDAPREAPRTGARKPKAGIPKASDRKGKSATFSRVPNEIAALVKARVMELLSDAAQAGADVPQTISMGLMLTLYVVWNEAELSDEDGAKMIRKLVDDKDMADTLVALRRRRNPAAVLSDRILRMEKDVRKMRDENDVTQELAAYILADRLALRKSDRMPATAYAIDFEDAGVKAVRVAAKRHSDDARRAEARRHNQDYQDGRR